MTEREGKWRVEDGLFKTPFRMWFLFFLRHCVSFCFFGQNSPWWIESWDCFYVLDVWQPFYDKVKHPGLDLINFFDTRLVVLVSIPYVFVFFLLHNFLIVIMNWSDISMSSGLPWNMTILRHRLPMARRVEYCVALSSWSSCSAPHIVSSPRCFFNGLCNSLLMTSQSNRTHLPSRTDVHHDSRSRPVWRRVLLCSKMKNCIDYWPRRLLLLLNGIISLSWAIIYLKGMGKEGLDILPAGG